MQVLENPFRSAVPDIGMPDGIPYPSTDMAAPVALLGRCPEAAVTPLVQADGLSNIARVDIKDERSRMGLGSFKALGAAYVIASAPDAAAKTYITASAGNHGLSVAAGGRAFGAKAVIFIAETVPASFAERLRALGAEVRREGADYEASMVAAARTAQMHEWTLLSDSSWAGYTKPPLRVMEGYLALMAEVFDQIEQPPTHIFLQAGVGGLAGACAAAVRAVWGEGPIIVVVEPEAAPALMISIQEGRAVQTHGPVSSMGRLDCKEPSLRAFEILHDQADAFMTLSDDFVAEAITGLEPHGFETSPSGGAGFAAVAALAGGEFGDLDETSRMLCIISEGPA